jgi:integrase
MATFAKRTNGHWQAKIRRKGVTLSKIFRLKAEAQKWATATEAAIDAGTYNAAPDAPALSFGELVNRYERDILPTLAPSEQRKRPGQLALWRERFAGRAAASITPADIAVARDEWAAAGLSPATINRRMAALAAVYTAAAKQWHLIPLSVHPVRAVARQPEHNERVRYLTADERAALLKATAASPNPYLHVAVVLSLATGWRQSEVMGLRWSRVDLQRGWLTLETSKNKDRRGIGIQGYVLELLRQLEKVRRADTELLFPARAPRAVNAGKPLPPMNLRKPWEAALAAAGIRDFRWHDMRHDLASRLAVAGASLHEIGKVLGHKTQRMSARYAHLSDEHLTDILGIVNAGLELDR